MHDETSYLNNNNPTKLPYKTPTLRNYGDIRDVTLGASPGPSDSGGLGLIGSRPGKDNESSSSRGARQREK